MSSPRSKATPTLEATSEMSSELRKLQSRLRRKKIAIVHDYLVEFGGAERVLLALHELFPEAPVYVSFADPERLGAAWEHFAGWDIRETWLSKLPFHTKLYSPYRVFAPKAFADLDLSEYDLVISSSNAYFAKAVSVPNGTQYCYCHTPPRALYGYTTGSNWKVNPVTRWVGSLINHFLRVVDVQISRNNVTQFIANSEETAARIAKFYKRESVVVYPPVDVPQQLPQDLPPLAERESPYYLYVNRLALAKHPELAVAVATKLQLPLKVVGTGPMLAKLKELAGPTVSFLGFVPDSELAQLYQGATAVLYPVEDEDFGIVPVEAQGYGVPVIAHNSGGPRETVIEGKTGVLFDELSEQAVEAAVQRFQAAAAKGAFIPENIHSHAQQFSRRMFQKRILHLLTS